MDVTDRQLARTACTDLRCAKVTEKKKKTDTEECNITLYTKESATDAEIFVTDCFGSSIIDTQSHRPIIIGNGKVVYPIKSVKIPAKNGNTKYNIETEEVSACQTGLYLLRPEANRERKCVYGLASALLNWYNRVKNIND